MPEKFLTSKRKFEHIEICLKHNVKMREKSTGFEDVEFIHRSLPEINKHEIETSIDFLGHTLNAPIIIAGMTGGHPVAKKINAELAKAAQDLSIGMGIGSQRAAIENPSLAYTYEIARKVAPDIFLIANLGAPQLVKGYSIDEAKKAVKMIDADALAIHLNPLQEALQSEGEIEARGYLKNIQRIAKELDVPVIAKETGAGISGEDALLLKKAGVAAIDIGGAGGTSWSGVESIRAKNRGDKLGEELGKTYWDWGIPTAVSTVEVAEAVGNYLKIIATGGIRSGLDVAKALALGADAAGVALPFLSPAYKEGARAVILKLKQMIEELRVAMFLVGARNISELKQSNVVVVGKTADWLKARGINLVKLSKRRK
ncbi:MAG: type 2 isopentenyl-diphosphate Delta-isomerase [Euryarchaeota archaeon]|nr:type 2 isopentenyl-diphosphate Delta-isomerase [Euryarchaeota archaeon]